MIHRHIDLDDARGELSRFTRSVYESGDYVSADAARALLRLALDLFRRAGSAKVLDRER